MTPHVLIAGGGIGGLSLALTLHQIGVPFTVLESAREMRPLGVGINLQPNAVRELFDLGISAEDLGKIGTPVREWALVARHGQDIYSEARGLDAGYKWPQFAVHRGEFQMLLARTLIRRAGAHVLCTDARVTGYNTAPDGRVTAAIASHGCSTRTETADLLIGADGIHSAVRAQMHPNQPPIHWGGALMWRGTSLARPLRTGASFVGLGGAHKRMVIYPISAPDADGLALVNWIAEITVPAPSDGARETWFRPAKAQDFRHHFAEWTFDWLNVPALIDGAGPVYENAMIDRDPVPTWVDGTVALIGDAAHPMYPTGSNGASQAIMDARNIGAAFLAHGVTPEAFAAYDTAFCDPVSKLVLRNREAGPFGLLNLIEDRSTGEITDIDALVPPPERAAFMETYKAAAGFDRDRLNAAEATVPDGARIA